MYPSRFPNLVSQSRCALLRPDSSNKLHMSIVSPFGYSDDDIDLSMIVAQGNNTHGEESTSDLSTKHLTITQPLPALDEMRIYENIDNILKSFHKKSITSSEMQTLEHRIWMNLSTLKDLPVILRCITLVEEFEITNFNASCNLNTEFTSLFSIQFHRNLCRLLEDVIFERQDGNNDSETWQMFASRKPHKSNYIQYVQSRTNLLKAYEMLVDINSQISLAAAAPPGTENNKWGKQNNARAEAICWAARRLAPTNSQTQNPLQRLPSTASMSPVMNAPSPNVSLLIRSSSFRANTESPDLQGLNSNNTPLTVLSHHVESGVIDRFHETVSVSSANSSIMSSPGTAQVLMQRPSSSPPPPSLHLSLDALNNSHRTLPLSTFLLFHHCVASNIFRQHSHPHITDYTFAYDEFAILLDVGEGYLPSIYQHGVIERNHMKEEKLFQNDHLVLHLAHPKVGKEMLAFIFISLLGDVFGLQKFSSAIEIMGLGGGLALRKSLPLMMAFMEAQTMSVVFNALVNRQLSASPLQRFVLP